MIDLFKDKSYNLIFLADRWFNSVNLMKFIENAGHTFVFRLKKNIKAFIYDKSFLRELKSQFFNFDIFISPLDIFL